MVLDWFGGSKGASLEELIARRKYGKAIEILRNQFKDGSRDPRMRMQLADVLVLAGKGREAVPILVGVADEFARDGFAAKAIAVLKKVERFEPGRQDVTRKLASLIEHQKEATGSFLVSRKPASLPEIGIEEIHEAPAEIARGIEARPPEPAAPPPPTEELSLEADAMTESAFDLQLHDLIEENLSTTGMAPAGETPSGVASASPLFSDFTEEELLAVIQGLDLLTFEPGDLIVTEAEAGDSLFILTTGTAKVFVRSPSGRNIKVREMEEGSFFGEISILTGKPRTATVTAATRCELLELDRAALDSVAGRHPRVREVLRRFYEQRAMSREEAAARRAPGGGSAG